ncbi:MAG: hypothetical protein AAF645_00310 [Myxococcota bacterium]
MLVHGLVASLWLAGCAKSRSSEDAAVEDASAMDAAGDASTVDSAIAPDATLADTATMDAFPADSTLLEDAEAIDAPPDIAPVDEGMPPSGFNRVFVSSQTFAMNLGGVAPYDAACNDLARAAGLEDESESNFIAWMSDRSSSAASRLGEARGFVRVNGEAFADELLASEVFRAVLLDESGASVPLEEVVATGTNPDGTSSTGTTGNCDNWSDLSLSSAATTGRADGGSRAWTSRGRSTCSIARRIYCLENVHVRELVPERETGRLIYLTNEDFDPGGSLSPAEACDASKPDGAGDVAPLLATTGTAASNVLADAVTYVRPDGIAVGTGAQLRAGEWQTGAWQEGNGAYTNELRRVWTGSERIDLPADAACEDWTTDSREIRGSYGFPDSPVNGAFWTLQTRRCVSSQDLRLYCVETSD